MSSIQRRFQSIGSANFQKATTVNSDIQQTEDPNEVTPNSQGVYVPKIFVFTTSTTTTESPPVTSTQSNQQTTDQISVTNTTSDPTLVNNLNISLPMEDISEETMSSNISSRSVTTSGLKNETNVKLNITVAAHLSKIESMGNKTIPFENIEFLGSVKNRKIFYDFHGISGEMEECLDDIEKMPDREKKQVTEEPDDPKAINKFKSYKF